MTGTFTLQAGGKEGLCVHTITFRPVGDQVEITERMEDKVMGDWLGNKKNRTIPVAMAREYYKYRKRFGYLAV